MASYPSECTNAGRRKAWVAGSTDKRLPMRSHTLTSTHAPRRICSTAITQEASESSTKGILSGSLQGTQGSDTLLWLGWMSAAKDGGPAGAGNRRSLHSRHPQEASEGPPLYQTSPLSPLRARLTQQEPKEKTLGALTQPPPQQKSEMPSLFPYCFCSVLVIVWGLRDLGSPTRDQTCAPCSESVES